MVQAVFKLGYQGQFHRVRFERDEVAYDDVLDLIKRTLPSVASCQAKYRDDEGDLCTLCALTFPDFLLSFEDKGVFKLELISIPESSRAPADAQDTPAAAASAERAAAKTEVLAGTQEGPRPCAMGCGFAATWHGKYCCGLCVSRGAHGPRCEGRRIPRAATPAQIERAAEEQCAESAEDTPSAAASDEQAAPMGTQAMGAGTGPQQAGTAEKPPRACANGCGFAATWHPHYCCGRCIATGKHGPRCEMKRIHQAAEDALEGPGGKAQHAASTGGARTEEAPCAAADAKTVSDNEEGCAGSTQPFAAELQQLEEMGFEVSEVLKEALREHDGDIAKLLVGMGLS